MSDYHYKIGLYWQALGGNNIDQISGHCYQYTDVVENEKAISTSTIIVDIGKFDNHQALGVKDSSAAVPDIRNLLEGGILTAEAIFLTHSHPDHLNGIVHYIRAGYCLPKIYGGKYTKMIMEALYDDFNIAPSLRPKFEIIKDGDVIKIGSMQIEAISASHTCFDALGFVISTPNSVVYHTGDMKIDSSTYFRKPTNIARIKELSSDICCVVADFYGIAEDGFAIKEVETFKKLVALIKKSKKKKIFIPVYPTHPEMYIIAFLAALKTKKNVVFYGNSDFYCYLSLIVDYGISFSDMAKDRIKVIYYPNEELQELGDEYVVIGTFNNLENHFDENANDCFGIITAKTFFNPLKGHFNAHNIKFVGVDSVPELQGFGHGFLGDYEYLNKILHNHPTFIPTHCPIFVIDSFRKLGEFSGFNLIKNTPTNNQVYRICNKSCILVEEKQSNWLVVKTDGDISYFTEVEQKPTSGEGVLKRTISHKRCQNKFEIFLHLRKKQQKRIAKI